MNESCKNYEDTMLAIDAANKRRDLPIGYYLLDRCAMLPCSFVFPALCNLLTRLTHLATWTHCACYVRLMMGQLVVRRTRR